jgi:hypothetical protein
MTGVTHHIRATFSVIIVHTKASVVKKLLPLICLVVVSTVHLDTLDFIARHVNTHLGWI